MIDLLNRELSWLDYNRRILEKARDTRVPLLERLRFLTYCSNNLDEFFMTRVGRIRDQLDAGIHTHSSDGLRPDEQMLRIRVGARTFLTEMYQCLNWEILPPLLERGIVIESFRKLSEDEQDRMRRYFHSAVAPILTPRAIDPGHPFPFLASRSLNMAVSVESGSGEHVILLTIPPSLPHFVPLAAGRFLPIGSLIAANVNSLVPSLRVLRTALFRIIRNGEIHVDEDASSLRESVEAELRLRERKPVVCIEIAATADEAVTSLIQQGTRCDREDLYPVSGFLRIADLAEICDAVHDEELRYRPFNPRLPKQLATTDDIFTIIRREDLLLHRPYDSFAPLLELLHAAATDPAVLMVSQTLYQTDENSAIAGKLIEASQNGKQVSVVVELQARFEESRNIGLARRLRDAGVQVIYGIAGLKTHCKLTLVVRKEDDGLRRYLHLSTGNYSAGTALAYTDFDLFTADPEFGEDASRLLNVLTGSTAARVHEMLQGDARPVWTRFVVAPFDYYDWLIRMIERETAHARGGTPARIVAKLNALEDPGLIRALYAASQGGVTIDLIVRGICCLVPGVPGLSDRITVTSVIDRFLEHSRAILFENGGAPEIYLSSGDWMPRNFRTRIELTFPLLRPGTRARLIDHILPAMLADHASAWNLQSDGTWIRRADSEGQPGSQEQFIRATRSESVAIGPYHESIASPTGFRRPRKKTARRGAANN